MNFAIIPLDVITDRSLTLRHLRVLMALYSFRDPKSTNVVWPGRKRLSDMTGYPESRISNTTTELEAMGWLKKEGKGGSGKSTRYTMASSRQTVTETVTVTDLENVSNGDRNSHPNGDRIGNFLGDRISHGNRPENIPVNKPFTIEAAKPPATQDNKQPSLSEKDSALASAQFEAAWVLYGRTGSKKTAARYWKKLSPEDREGVLRAMPVYLRVVAAGRRKKDFQGWINPENAMWDQDWASSLKEWTKDDVKEPARMVVV